MNVSQFIETHYRHFNAAVVVEAADCWRRHLEDGGRVMITLAGAMSTAELGRSLAELIRQEKVHAICCTGANLEEDVFNLVAHEHYRRVPEWRNLTPQQEKDLEHAGLNRVTDTCIPEDRAFRAIERHVLELWQAAETAGERLFPHQFMYRLLRERLTGDDFSGDPADSWLLAAAECDLPIIVPGWEDSTLGNILVAHVLEGDLASTNIVRSGLEAMAELADWYCRTTMGRGLAELEAAPPTEDGDGGPAGGEGAHRAVRPEDAERTVGFFQIGGGIAGDFPICVVPLIHQDLRRPCPYWGWFCQIGDSTTSYGSYSGAIPSEKITWGKLDVDTPMYMIALAGWYQKTCADASIGFFQIGGGIAGDFPICVVPMIEQDLGRQDIPRWGYFCQISDSTTSYGSYSGAVPNEKITWGKLSADTPKYIIESDATIVAPLVFACVLGI